MPDDAVSKLPVIDPSVNFIPDLVFSVQNDKPLLLDMYLPKNATEVLPLIIWIHGGGWRFGDRRLAPELSRYFAARGFAMASIEYRLSGEAVFPAQVHDVKAAIRWLRAHAEQYGFDAERIGLWGSSAGAHLATLVALTGDKALEADNIEYPEQSVDVQAVVNGYGPTDFSQMDAQHKAIPPEAEDPESVRVPPGKKTADADSFESLLIGYPINERPNLVQAANPVNYARPEAPPFLILHGLSDAAVPSHQSELLYEALASHHNDVTLYLVKGLGHGFLNRNDFDRIPRLAELRRNYQGKQEEIRQQVQLTFETIEIFFRQHLG